MLRFFSLFLIPLVFVCNLEANEANDDDLDLLLSEVTELATKSKLNLDYTPGVISIIYGDELREMGISHLDANVTDLFPGFSYGASRASTDFTKYIIMLNGMVLNTELTGVNVFPRFNTKIIKRIEVIRGPSSALYGGNAFSAIINIITKDNVNEGNLVWLDHSAYSSSNQATSVGALMNHQQGDLKLGMRLHANQTDGPDVTITQDAGSLAGPRTEVPAKLDFSMDNYDLGLNLEYRDLKFKYARQHYGFSEHYGMSNAYLPPKRNDNTFVETQDLAELSYTTSFKEWQLEAKFGAMHYEFTADDAFISPLDETNDLLLEMDFKERNFYAQLDAQRDIDKHHLLFGGRTLYSKLYHSKYGSTMNLETGEIYPTTTIIPDAHPTVSRKIHSLWIQDHYELNEKFSIIANLRYDTITDIDEDEISPRIAFIYQPNETHIIKAQYAHAFRVPVYFFLYGDGTKSIISGYPDLGLDRSNNYELSYIYKLSDQSIKTTLYHTDMYQVHGYSQAGSVVTEHDNSIQTSGIEIEYIKTFNDLKINANIGYNFDNKMKLLGGNPYDGEILPFPELVGNFRLTYPIMPDVSFSLWYHYKGPVYQYGTETKFDENHIVNLALNYTPKYFEEKLKLTLSINDLFDEGYNRVPAPNSYKEEERITNQQRVALQMSYEF